MGFYLITFKGVNNTAGPNGTVLPLSNTRNFGDTILSAICISGPNAGNDGILNNWFTNIVLGISGGGNSSLVQFFSGDLSGDTFVALVETVA